MKTYKVLIVETYKREIEVSSDNEEEAYEYVEKSVNSGEIDLPCDGGKYDYERELFVNEVRSYGRNNC